MMDWLAQNGPALTTVCFFVGFIGIAIWAYLPRNKQRIEAQGNIPLQEPENDAR
jgi:cbb3-type cytochrome oxidase subunit 3